MKKYSSSKILVTGIGITSSIGQGKTNYINGLYEGNTQFNIMKRVGRQKDTEFLGAELQDLYIPEQIPKRVLRTASLSGQVALATLHEAWEDAGLEAVDKQRIGLIIGGSNFQQRELIQLYEKYSNNIAFLRPTYAMSFLDSDICGLCTEQFGIRGFAYTMGGASASGQACIIQAINAVNSGQVDVCIAIGALMDVSYLECQGFRAIGAMGSDKYSTEPQSACRPFDKNRDGFVFGESCGIVVIEKADHAEKRSAKSYGSLLGWSMYMDANRNPNPSFDGEVKVIKEALKLADKKAEEIDYVNPHGTGSPLGDETELKALKECKLNHVHINATKSIIGHGLSSAGAVELITVLLQMQEQKLHISKNLDNPMDTSFNWVRNKPVKHKIENAINLSMGFGGINTAICLSV